MTTQTADPESFLPQPPAAFHILMVLAKEENHGYAIMAGLYQRLPACVRPGRRLAFGVAIIGLLIMSAVALGLSFVPDIADFVFDTLWRAPSLFLPSTFQLPGKE